MNRDSLISGIDKKQWDVIVIGGGATGLGTALDATLRGYKTILLEKEDFAKGTSSRSTKLIHGGVRYLAQGNISLVKEALRERGLLIKNAAHLVSDLKFILPNYSWWRSLYYLSGLKIYDLLSGKLSIGKTKFLKKSKVFEKLSTINSKGLKSGVLYHDGQFDDARLAINLMQSIVENKGTAINHMGVTDLIKNGDNKTSGVIAKDQFNGKTYQVKGKAIINAAGVFTDDILNMNYPNHKKTVVPSQGIHLVVDQSFLPEKNGLMIPKTSDGRVLFAVPWHKKVVIGTTDTLMEKEAFEPRATEQEINFIINTANKYLTKNVTRENVLSVFAGLRPLAAPDDDDKNTKEVSRGHKIIIDDTGLISVIGGKWTTYRQMAEDIIDKVIKKHSLPQVSCKTKNFSIYGNIPQSQIDQSNHLYVYGHNIQDIKNLQKESPEYAKKIHPRYEATFAEVIWAVRQEMAKTIEDVLARRIRFLFIDARAAIDVAKPVAECMAKEMGCSSEWIKKEVDEFINLANEYLLIDYKSEN